MIKMPVPGKALFSHLKGDNKNLQHEELNTDKIKQVVYHTGTNATRGKGSHWNPILCNKYVQTELLLLLPLASPLLFHLTCATVPLRSPLHLSSPF